MPTIVDTLIQHLVSKDFKLWEALKRLQQEDRMTWLLSMSGTLADNTFSVPAIINEDILFIRMYAIARVAPTTDNCIIQVWHNDGKGAYKFSNTLNIGIGATKSNIIIPSTGGKIRPKDPKLNDFFYLDVIQAGGVRDVTVSIECKREAGRLEN